MTTMTDSAVLVTGGVDTHKYTHVAVALDERGALLGTGEFAATGAGYKELLDWLEGFGAVDAVGVEGTGSWGAGLCRSLLDADITVHEVGRPNRQRRRRAGKSDPADAEAAARAVQANDGLAVPKSRSGAVESMRLLRIARSSTSKTINLLANQMHAIIDTGPEAFRARHRGRTLRAVASDAAASAPRGHLADPQVAAATTLRRLARRWLELTAELADIDNDLKALLALAAPPALMAEFGVGPDVASTLLVSAGDNPTRLHSNGAAAALWGSSPVDASSGLQQRHRLNRGGDRQANRALHTIVITRLRYDPVTQAYLARRINDGKTKKEAIRCLKRYLARRIWHIITQPPNLQHAP